MNGYRHLYSIFKILHLAPFDDKRFFTDHFVCKQCDKGKRAGVRFTNLRENEEVPLDVLRRTPDLVA